jgi:hypothetical protein
MISDKDDQASSCSGQLLGRDHMHMQVLVDANAPSRVLGLGHTQQQAARAVRLDGGTQSRMFFLAAHRANRLSTAARGNWQIAHTQPQPPPSPICFFPSSSESCRYCLQVACHVAVGGGVAGKRRACVALANEIWAGLQTPVLASATTASQCDGRAVRLCL